MSPRSVFITGCNRGIGLELVKQHLLQENPPKFLFATYRSMSDELKKLSEENSTVKLIKMDVTDYASYPGVVQQVEDVVGTDGLNLLINNAGYLPPNRDLKSVTPEDMRAAYEINCIAPLFLAKAMLPLLQTAAKASGESPMSVNKAAIIQMSTAVGSIAENSGGNNYAYRCSKSALNQSMKTLSIDLKDTGILIMAMHPGWVLTEMGGPNAQITTETCCSTMIKTLDQLAEKDYATFLRYNNTPIAW